MKRQTRPCHGPGLTPTLKTDQRMKMMRGIFLCRYSVFWRSKNPLGCLGPHPRAPAPPRPLIPRRQPSYTLPDAPSGRMSQKTLILDLDETLIHSMAKGGRMSTGHMVEVKLNTIVGAGGNAAPGPQHPILYWVNKRPHCDDFLRRVSCPCHDYIVHAN